MKSHGSPIITDMKVIPVAGYDSALLTLSGCHIQVSVRSMAAMILLE